MNKPKLLIITGLIMCSLSFLGKDIQLSLGFMVMGVTFLLSGILTHKTYKNTSFYLVSVLMIVFLMSILYTVYNGTFIGIMLLIPLAVLVGITVGLKKRQDRSLI
jgi:hypothetical protein